MTQEETIRLTTALLDFIERVTGPGATAEELATLPRVAEVLSKFC